MFEVALPGIESTLRERERERERVVGWVDF
jgi:hypothetical protein